MEGRPGAREGLDAGPGSNPRVRDRFHRRIRQALEPSPHRRRRALQSSPKAEDDQNLRDLSTTTFACRPTRGV